MPSRPVRRRSLLKAALAVLPAVGLAGCGLVPSFLPEPPGIVAKPVTLNLYYGPFFVQGGGQSPEGTLINGIVASYKQAHSNVTINATELSFGVFQNFQALIDPTSPTHADLFLGQFVGRFGNINVQDAIEPVDAYMKRDKSVTTADFYPPALHLWWREGKQLGLPRDIQPNNIIYYNRGILKGEGVGDPPDGWTTDDFLNYLQQIAKAGESSPTTNPRHWAYVDLNINQAFQDFIQIFGGRTTNYPDTPPRAMYDTDQAIAGAQFYVDLYTKYHFSPDRFARAGVYSLSAFPEFLTGTVPLFLAPSNLIATLQDDQHPLDWDITLEPIRPDVKQSWNGTGLGVFMIKGVSDPDTAWDVVKYLTAGDGMKQRAERGDVHPAYKKIAESSVYLTSKPPLGKRLFNTVGMSQMIDVDPSTLPPTTPTAGTPVPGTQPDVNAMMQYLNFALDDMLTGKADVAQTMRDANQKANAGLRG